MFKIKDSIDIYTIQDNILLFYFINTRRLMEYKVNEKTINLIKLIDGEKDSKEIAEVYNQENNSEISVETVNKIMKFLVSINVVVEKKHNIIVDKRYERQINYLSEFNIGECAGINNQKKIEDSKIVIFGVGAMGGDIALLLAMAGVENFIILDFKKVKESDKCRHMYYRKSHVGKSKVQALKEEIQKINSKAKVKILFEKLIPNKNIDELIKSSTFVINTADEPYIGYTSLKISKKCVELRKPHYIAGGFNIHNMSTGELIIPGKTPCVSCYMNYFEKALKDWKPEQKKIRNEFIKYGGFASQSLFSSSYAAVQIIKFICGVKVEKNNYLTRGEMDIDTYKIKYLDVKKDPKCLVCGGILDEA
ncbi:MAG: ThiF family adenylyltransferase [Fusobacterium sp. JB019]|nr:ThiF family adenylyltransferase [Fusobacterium sp. JB019]